MSDLKEQVKKAIANIIDLNKETSLNLSRLNNLIYEELMNRIPDLTTEQLIKLFNVLLRYSHESLKTVAGNNNDKIVNQIVISELPGSENNEISLNSHTELRELGRLYNDNLK